MGKLPGGKKLETEGKTATAAGKVQNAASGLQDAAGKHPSAIDGGFHGIDPDCCRGRAAIRWRRILGSRPRLLVNDPGLKS
jgi:hypothetical protein